MRRRLLARFWTAVDNEGVILFQFIFGVGFILMGLYGTFIADQAPPLSLRGAMGDSIVTIWYWLLVAGPACCLLGKAMHGQIDYAGRWMQLTGDLVLSLALLAYIAGTVQIESWGKGDVGAFLGAMLSASAAITVTRDVRRLLDIEKRVK